MAKRKRLTTPDANTLREMEDGFAAKPLETKSITPPIAQVAGDAAASGLPNVTDRAEAARNKAEADALRKATDAGLVAQPIPLEQIDTAFIHRDRVAEDAEAMAELLTSVRQHGLRNPIEVAKTRDGFGLISGYRRVQAFRQLAVTDPAFRQIPSFVRRTDAGVDAYINMVEENEVRANLSHYERGRIAVLAAGQGVFPSVEAAVDALFASASKAKRSKVRSFAVVHEGLGDLLRFPTALTEKAGLRLAMALRDGGQTSLRAALDAGTPEDAAAEWRLLEAGLKGLVVDPGSEKGGRPTSVIHLDPVPLTKGAALTCQISGDKTRIELSGRPIDEVTAQKLLQNLKQVLE
ncbi:ParB/RepB/Spo0J family partition protein [Halovulum sp. GXIMD14793]